MSLKRFRSVEDILALPSFIPSNPVSLATFASFAGDYHLKQPLKCCVEEKGRLCQQAHNHGWVVNLKDGTTSIIGTDCAKTKFDSDDGFRARRVEAESERRSDDIRRAFGALLVNEAEDRKRLVSAINALADLRRLVLQIREALGISLVTALLDLHRKARGTVQMPSYIDREVFNPSKREMEVRTVRTMIDVGRLPVPEALEQAVLSRIEFKLNAAASAYARIDSLEKKPIAKLASHLSDCITGVPPASARTIELQKQVQSFLGSDLRLLYVVSPNPKDQLRSAQFIANLNGSAVSTADARRAVVLAVAAIRQGAGVRSAPRREDDQ